MKETAINIGKNVLAYLAFMVVINILSAIILGNYYVDKSFLEIFVLLACNNSLISENSEILFNIIMALKKLVEGISLAVLASFIFANILNRRMRIIFPDKVVLRRRTSEGSEGKLTLGILIGNPGKYWIYDVKCSVNCTYLKQNRNIEQRNSETYLKQNIEFIQNYFRFSFEVNNFPKKFWKHFLERKEEYVNNDFLIVTIMGKTNGLGGYFRVCKKYSIQDIIIDVHDPEKSFIKKVRNIFNGEEKTKIDWKVFPKCIEAGEDERQGIINEIRNYIGEAEERS